MQHLITFDSYMQVCKYPGSGNRLYLVCKLFNIYHNQRLNITLPHFVDEMRKSFGKICVVNIWNIKPIWIFVNTIDCNMFDKLTIEARYFNIVTMLTNAINNNDVFHIVFLNNFVDDEVKTRLNPDQIKFIEGVMKK